MSFSSILLRDSSGRLTVSLPIRRQQPYRLSWYRGKRRDLVGHWW